MIGSYPIGSFPIGGWLNDAQATHVVVADIDALIKRSGVAATLGIDALLRQAAAEAVGLDAVVKADGVSVGADLDAVIRAEGITAGAGLDAVVKSGDAAEASLDAVVKKAGVGQGASLDAMIRAAGVSATAGLDAILHKLVTAQVDVDAAVQATQAAAASLDAVVATGYLEEAVDLDAVIGFQGDAAADLDGVVKKTFVDRVLRGYYYSLITAPGHPFYPGVIYGSTRNWASASSNNDDAMWAFDGDDVSLPPYPNWRNDSYTNPLDEDGSCWWQLELNEPYGASTQYSGGPIPRRLRGFRYLCHNYGRPGDYTVFRPRLMKIFGDVNEDMSTKVELWSGEGPEVDAEAWTDWMYFDAVGDYPYYRIEFYSAWPELWFGETRYVSLGEVEFIWVQGPWTRMDALVKKIDLAAAVDLDAAIQVGGAAAAGVDGLIQRALLTEATEMDGIVKGLRAAVAGLDVVVRSSDAGAAVGLDGLLQSGGLSVLTGLDAAVSIERLATAAMDARLVVGQIEQLQMDGVLKASGVAALVGLDAAIEATLTAAAAIDGLIAQTMMVSAGLDARLFGATRVLTGLDARLMDGIYERVGMDAAIRPTGYAPAAPRGGRVAINRRHTAAVHPGTSNRVRHGGTGRGAVKH